MSVVITSAASSAALAASTAALAASVVAKGNRTETVQVMPLEKAQPQTEYPGDYIWALMIAIVLLLVTIFRD